VDATSVAIKRPVRCDGIGSSLCGSFSVTRTPQ
jgi:hypothetical protein